MTCVVGVAEGGLLYLAGDSALSWNGRVSVSHDPKVFERDGWLIGVCGSPRMRDVLLTMTWPAFSPGDHLRSWLVAVLVEDIRDAFKTAGWAKKIDEREWGGTFLLGCVDDGQARLFEIDADYQVVEPSAGWAAIGSGADIAAGSLYSTEELRTLKRLEIALSAATDLTAYVRPPFRYVTLDRDGKAGQGRLGDI